MNKSLADLKIVIVGLGLIGGSIARGLSAPVPQSKANTSAKVEKTKKLCREIIAVGRNESILQQALADGIITDYATDVAQACVDADLVIIAVPSLTVEKVLQELKPVIGKDTVVTDAASVKGAIIDSAFRVYGKVPENFVPGHPIAGSENSGYSASLEDLYKGKKVILTPLDETSQAAVSLVQILWESLGAEVIKMSVAHHDQVLAATSHLPHLLAYALVDTLSQQGQSEEIFRYAAGGFRDFTRIASSDPQMWHDIFMLNGEATIEVLDKYMTDLSRLRAAIKNRDSNELMATFKRAKKSRDKFLEHFPKANK